MAFFEEKINFRCREGTKERLTHQYRHNKDLYDSPGHVLRAILEKGLRELEDKERKARPMTKKQYANMKSGRKRELY